MKLRMIFAFIALLGTAWAVQAQKMIVDVDKQVDFKAFKTFGFSEKPFAPKPTTSQFLAAAIEREMTSRGLVRNDADPDITITVLAGVGMDLKGIGPTWNNEIYKSWGGYSNPSAMMTISTGSLLIDIFVTKSNNGIFRAVGKEIFVAPPSSNPEKDAKEMEKTVNKTVSKMFKKYPVKPKK